MEVNEIKRLEDFILIKTKHANVWIDYEDEHLLHYYKIYSQRVRTKSTYKKILIKAKEQIHLNKIEKREYPLFKDIIMDVDPGEEVHTINKHNKFDYRRQNLLVTQKIRPKRILHKLPESKVDGIFVDPKEQHIEVYVLTKTGHHYCGTFKNRSSAKSTYITAKKLIRNGKEYQVINQFPKTQESLKYKKRGGLIDKLLDEENQRKITYKR